eukprot:gnl/TRDRNA2_/TRDRNA2_115755_c0_seq2.p1 gnl/TRDRNA2_/TRDRNA2_115755_c0~~gnl/TRDRNA2_/TRDRNA2_115755_c0_seq2.p1  ORF type:complete len:553 (-),score=78.71 gnl/TRDRNA2_/TRDRNA2_115755_c0_seq2:50-1708(-)
MQMETDDDLGGGGGRSLRMFMTPTREAPMPSAAFRGGLRAPTLPSKKAEPSADDRQPERPPDRLPPSPAKAASPMSPLPCFVPTPGLTGPPPLGGFASPILPWAPPMLSWQSSALSTHSAPWIASDNRVPMLSVARVNSAASGSWSVPPPPVAWQPVPAIVPSGGSPVPPFAPPAGVVFSPQPQARRASPTPQRPPPQTPIVAQQADDVLTRRQSLPAPPRRQPSDALPAQELPVHVGRLLDPQAQAIESDAVTAPRMIGTGTEDCPSLVSAEMEQQERPESCVASVSDKVLAGLLPAGSSRKASSVAGSDRGPRSLRRPPPGVTRRERLRRASLGSAPSGGSLQYNSSRGYRPAPERRNGTGPPPTAGSTIQASQSFGVPMQSLQIRQDERPEEAQITTSRGMPSSPTRSAVPGAWAARESEFPYPQAGRRQVGSLEHGAADSRTVPAAESVPPRTQLREQPPPLRPSRPSPSPMRYQAATIHDLKLELIRRGLDSIFCYSKEDLVSRLCEADAAAAGGGSFVQADRSAWPHQVPHYRGLENSSSDLGLRW